MKKKWIALKRRWKKLSPFDRRFYRVQAIVIAFNLLTLPFTWTAICSLLWVGLLTYVYSMELARRRVCQWIYYYEGRWRQIGLDNKHVAEASAIKSEYCRLHSDYKKLEYDYNQLKKSINNPKKK